MEKLNILQEQNVVERIIEGEGIGKIDGQKECKEWAEKLKRKEGVLGEVGLDVDYKDFLAFVAKANEKKGGGQVEGNMVAF